MANPIEPSIKNPSGAEVKTLKRQETLDATVGTPDFGQAFNALAMTPTLTQELGSRAAQSASNAMMTKLGYEAGKNPHGDLFPSLTKADEVYKSAYLAQSQNTLQLNFSSLMNQSQEDLAQAQNLTPELISSYTKQLAQSAKELVDSAPTEIKGQLAFGYANRLQNSSHNLNMKLIQQNKAAELDKMKTADKQTDIDIMNNAMGGNQEDAYTLYLDKVATNKKQRESGMMTASEELASNESAKISYYTAVSNAQAIAAREKGDKALMTYMDSLADFKNKPADLSYDQYVAMGRNTLSLMNHMDSLQQLDRQTTLTGLNAKVADRTLTDLDVKQAAANPALKDQDINNLTAKWATASNKSQNEALKLAQATTGFTNTFSYAALSTSDQNKAFDAIVQARKESNPGLAPGVIEAEVASLAGGPNTRFFGELTALSRSPLPEELDQASTMFHSVYARSPENLIGLDQATFDNIAAFDSFKNLNPNDINKAAFETRQAMLPKTKDQKEAIYNSWKEYSKDNLATSAQKMSFAKKILDANDFFFKPDVLGSNVTAQHIYNIMNRFHTILGDTAAAKKSTELAAKMTYGETYVNGKKEVANLPIEKFVNGGPSTSFFAQHDIVNQMQAQFGEYRAAYDAGKQNMFYRIKNPERWNLSTIQSNLNTRDELIKQIDSIKDSMLKISDQGYYKGMAQETKYQNLMKEQEQLVTKLQPINKALYALNNWKQPIEVEQVYRGQGDEEGRTNTFNLSVDAGENTSFSYDSTQPIIGNYDVFLNNEKGGRQSIQEMGGRSVNHVVYTPNSAMIKNYANALTNKLGDAKSYEEAMKEFNLRTKKESEDPGTYMEQAFSAVQEAIIKRRKNNNG
jgi:hypothetical protein